MKKSIVIFMALMMVAPAFANTVKQNNYSEELNTEVVSDFVNKRVKYTVTEVDKATGQVKTTVKKIDGAAKQGVMSSAQNYIDIKEKNIERIREKQNELATYYDAKINEVQSKALEIRNNSNAKSEAQLNTIVSVYDKQASELQAIKESVIGKLQADIDEIQAEIDSINATKK